MINQTLTVEQSSPVWIPFFMLCFNTHRIKIRRWCEIYLKASMRSQKYNDSFFSAVMEQSAGSCRI
jgi:hypothetical protein